MSARRAVAKRYATRIWEALGALTPKQRRAIPEKSEGWADERARLPAMERAYHAQATYRAQEDHARRQFEYWAAEAATVQFKPPSST